MVRYPCHASEFGYSTLKKVAKELSSRRERKYSQSTSPPTPQTPHRPPLKKLAGPKKSFISNSSFPKRQKGRNLLFETSTFIVSEKKCQNIGRRAHFLSKGLKQQVSSCEIITRPTNSLVYSLIHSKLNKKKKKEMKKVEKGDKLEKNSEKKLKKWRKKKSREEKQMNFHQKQN